MNKIVLIFGFIILLIIPFINAQVTYYPGDIINESVTCRDNHGSVDIGCFGATARVFIPDGTIEFKVPLEVGDDTSPGGWVFNYHVSLTPIFGGYRFDVNLTNINGSHIATTIPFIVSPNSNENISIQVGTFSDILQTNISTLLANIEEVNQTTKDISLNLTKIRDRITAIDGNLSEINITSQNIAKDVKTLFDSFSSNFTDVFTNFTDVINKLIVINNSNTFIEEDTINLLVDTGATLLNLSQLNASLFIRISGIDGNLSLINTTVADIQAAGGLDLFQNETLYSILGNATAIKTTVDNIETDIGVGVGETLKGFLINMEEELNTTRFLISQNQPQAHNEIYERTSTMAGFLKFEIETRPNGVVDNPQVFIDVPTSNKNDYVFHDSGGNIKTFIMMKDIKGGGVVNYQVSVATCLTFSSLLGDDKCPAITHFLFINEEAFQNATSTSISFATIPPATAQFKSQLLQLGAKVSPTKPEFGAIVLIGLSIFLILWVWVNSEQIKRKVKTELFTSKNTITVKEHQRNMRRKFSTR